MSVTMRVCAYCHRLFAPMTEAEAPKDYDITRCRKCQGKSY